MRLLIVDDHEVVRRGVRSLLSHQTGWHVCGEAVDGQDALDKAGELKPDLIIMDVSMPRLNGLEATRKVRLLLPGCEVLILSQHENSEMARQALKAGARGYIVKSSISKDLISAIEKAARHEYFFDTAILDQSPTTHTDAHEILQRSAAFEKALRESEEHLHLVTRSMAASVTRCSKDLRYLWANEGYAAWLQRPLDRIVGKQIIDVLGKEGFDKLLPHFKRVLSGERVSYEEEVTFQGIGRRWISAVYTPTRDAAGTPDGWVAVVWDITDRRRTEEALLESQRQLAQALDSSQTAMFDWDLVERRGKWNAQMAAIYGFSPEGAYITMDEWRSLFHPDDTARLAEEAERVWRGTDEQFAFEFRTVRGAGEIRWILSHGRIVRDAKGNAVRMIGTHADISDRKRAEEAVQRSEARLRAAFSQTYSFVVLLQPDGTIIEANRAALDAAGVNIPNQLTGRKFWEPWWSPLPQEVAILNDAIRRAATGEMVRGECEFCLPDGTRRICDRTLSPVLDDKGKVTMIVATGLDVTERKQTEAATGLLASIVANSDDAIISKTLDGIVTSWNKGAEAMFGYSSSEAVGRSITLIVPPDRHEEEIDILGRLGRGERIVHFETIRRRRNNSLIELSLTISPIRDSLGKIVGASTIARDISARKHAERMIGRGARQQKALFRLADELLRAGSLEDVYSAALNALLDALQCNRASILLCDAAGIMRFQSWRGLSDEYRAAVEGHTAWRKDDPNPQPVCINNVDAADISEPLKATVKKEGIAALAFIPLLSNGCLIGKFMTYFNMPNDFSHDQIELSVTIARQLAYAIERKRNDEALRESEARLRKLSETLDAEVSRQTEQLRTLSYDLLRTQDEERRHIARELHDSAGQLLTVLGMNLAQLEDEAARRAPRLSKKLEEAENLVQQLHRELRTTSYLLHPPLLDESGLSSALNWYAQGLTERSGIVIDVQAPENGPRLPGDMELAIFRLVQESLTNIHRHSGSKLASIRLTFLETAVEVEIRDQGKGITSDRLAEIQSGRAGVGIRGMQERMRRFEGKLSLASDESGTRVLAQIPMPHASRSNNAAAIHAVVG